MFVLGGVGGVLTAKITPLCRDDLLSNDATITDNVVSFSSCINP